MVERGLHSEPSFAPAARVPRVSLDLFDYREVCSVEAPDEASDEAVD